MKFIKIYDEYNQVKIIPTDRIKYIIIKDLDIDKIHVHICVDGDHNNWICSEEALQEFQDCLDEVPSMSKDYAYVPKLFDTTKYNKIDD